MCGPDVTHQALATGEVVARVADPSLVGRVDAHAAVEPHGAYTRVIAAADRLGRRPAGRGGVGRSGAGIRAGTGPAGEVQPSSTGINCSSS